MRIRIFGDRTGVQDISKYLRFLRMEMGGGAWEIEECNGATWLPPPERNVADLHIYVETPVRLAVPWSRYNVLLNGGWLATPFEWASTEMDSMVTQSPGDDRKKAMTRIRGIIKAAQRGAHPPAMPPAAPTGEPPKVAIITVTRNRQDWWANMIQNVTQQKWPVSRLEWIIVDDGDEGQQLTEVVAEFQRRLPAFVVKHVLVPGVDVLSVGAKRNMAVEAASPDTSLFVCMDDDDHYPSSSVEVRAAWLRRAACCYCGTIPVYDIRKYVSAFSAAPLDDVPEDRVSEATLGFTRAFWEARHFPDVSMAEGGAFVEGRVGETVEIPPVGVIVSFIHGANSSSRRVPADQPPNGCHFGLADHFFRYLHENFGKSEGDDDEAMPALTDA
jgi:hypothetical protein